MPKLADATLKIGSTPASRAYVGSDQVWGQSALAGPPKAGFAGTTTWTSTPQQVADEMTLAAWAGADFVRVDLYWYLIEGAKGVFDWSTADARFDAADSAGLKVLWVVSGSPAWARTGGEAAATFLPTSPSTLAAFLTTAVTRYATRGALGGHHWEVWNEPNTDWYMGDATQVTQYVACLSASYAAIKAADPTAQVLIGGILRGGRNDNLYQCITDDYWLTQFYAAGGKPYFDIFSYHPYCYPFDPANTTAPDHTNGASVEHGWQGVTLMKAVLAANGDARKPFWVTEWGQHTGTETNAVSAATQATYLDSAFARAQTASVERLFVFGPRDAGTDPANREHGFGLVAADFTPKAALRSFRNQAALGNGTTVPAVTSQVAPTYVTGTQAIDSFTATRTTTALTGVLAGDVLVAFCHGASSATETVAAGEAGWTEIGDLTLDGGRVHVLVKTATGAQGSVVFTWSGSHHHSVVLVAYRGGVAPTALTAGVTNRLVDVSLPNAQIGHAGAVLVCDGFCSNYTSVPVWTNGMTARFTRDVAIAGYVVADQSFTDSDAWTGSKTFTPGNGGSAALILASSVLIKTP